MEVQPAPLPRLATVANTAKAYTEAGVTASAIRNQLYKAEVNGLAASGAVSRHGHKVVIDLHKYGAWLAGGR